MSILEQILMPYQLAWVMDPARFKIGMWSRQTGKSFATAAEAVGDCFVNPGAMWVVLSAGERQALEWMEKAKLWAKAYALAIADYSEVRDGAETLIKRAEIRFGNGSRIQAIPANPATARGYSANLILDEFAIHEKPAEIWAAIYPSITNPLTGEKKLRIVSTPKGRGNKFADLWEHNSGYSKHKVTIHDAAAAGLRVDIEALRAGLDDDELWAQEYLCEFIDSSMVMLTYEMLGACESDSIAIPADAPRYIGMDIGRRKDLSVLITVADIGAGRMAVERVEVLERAPFAEQLEFLLARASSPLVKSAAVDATGIGAMIAEEARRKSGGKVREFVFTSTSKTDIYQRMRRRFEERSVVTPVDRALREDLHRIQRVVLPGGGITFKAPSTDDGHSDRAAALALALWSATAGYGGSPVVFDGSGFFGVGADRRI